MKSIVFFALLLTVGCGGAGVQRTPAVNNNLNVDLLREERRAAEKAAKKAEDAAIRAEDAAKRAEKSATVSGLPRAPREVWSRGLSVDEQKKVCLMQAKGKPNPKKDLSYSSAI